MAKEQLLINLVLARLKRGIPSDTNAHQIIEDSMDLINYDDNCTIDEIAQRIRKRISEESAPSGEDFDVWEKRIMQSMRDETERRWNRLEKMAKRIDQTEKDTHGPMPDIVDSGSLKTRSENTKTWQKTLDRLDMLDQRLKQASQLD